MNDTNEVEPVYVDTGTSDDSVIGSDSGSDLGSVSGPDLELGTRESYEINHPLPPTPPHEGNKEHSITPGVEHDVSGKAPPPSPTTPEEKTVVVMTPSERKALNRKKYRNRKKNKKKNRVSSDGSGDTEPDDSPVPELVTTPQSQPQSQSKQMASYLSHWNQMYNIVTQFKEQYNRLPTIRGTHKMEATVGRWIYTQQLYMKKNILPHDLVEKLRSLGI